MIRPRAIAPYLYAFLVALPTGVASAQTWEGKVWPKADRLFHSDPRWLGADAAYSIPLDGDRILWLFGDTFVGNGQVKRKDSAFIRTSIAVQRGRDPSRAEIEFHWRTGPNGPISYFPASESAWLWPLHGAYRNGGLTLFFSRVIPSDEGLGFRGVGHVALRCENPDDAPDAWRFRALALPAPPISGDIMLYGVAILDSGEQVLAYCVIESGGHTAYLLRWRSKDFDRGDLTSPEWWDGGAYRAKGTPAALFSDAATEFSVHRAEDGRFLQVQTLGFGATDIGMRFAPRPEGPWSAPEAVYRPPESRKRDTFVYAAKAHPELAGAPILLTYAANHFDFGTLLRSRTLYYPRFVRLEPGARR